MIRLKSETLKKYYGEIPREYDLKFIHFEIDISKESKDEYQFIEEDLKAVQQYVQDSFMIYFSDIDNLCKMIKNTKIIENYFPNIYIRIRNSREYEQYKSLKCNLTLIIELSDLKKISCDKDNIIIQINTISELSLDALRLLLKKYNIQKILLGQIAYITEDYTFLLDALQDKYEIDKSQILELEKNNKITNDMYTINEYIKIYNEISKFVNKYQEKNQIEQFRKIFNFLATNIYYDDNGIQTTKITNQNLIGPIFYKKCVCEGYSKLLWQVCSLMNIEAIVVSGGGSKETDGHIWNQVYINGVWYNADLTATSYAIHHKENWNLFLVSDDKLKYKCVSPFKHICKKSYDAQNLL